MFFTEAYEGQPVTLKLAIRESDIGFELNEGLEGTIDSFIGEEVRVEFEYELNGRDWKDCAYIRRVELPDYFEEFEEGED